MPDPDGSFPGGEAGLPGLGGGQTGAVLLSPFIKPGTVSISSYNHYSLLASIEDLFGLHRLGEANDGVRLGTSSRSLPPPAKTRAAWVPREGGRRTDDLRRGVTRTTGTSHECRRSRRELLTHGNCCYALLPCGRCSTRR
jgi:hypothetical protein